MNDPYMPLGIDAWGNQGLAKSKAEINAYLANMFNDQISMNKALTSKVATYLKP